MRTVRHGRVSFPLMNGPGRQISTLLVLAAIGLSGCGWFHFGGDDKQAVERHLSQAKKLYEQRDYLGAIRAYEDILKIQPRYARAHLKIGLIYDHNLKDHLSAAYHYQRFLQLSDSDSAEADLARSSLENARLQFAATVPNSSGQGSPEVVQLRSENVALHRQVDELKRDIVRLRGKLAGSDPRYAVGSGEARSIRGSQKTEPPIVPSPSPPPRVQTPPTAKPVIKPSPISKTYVIKKGDGIQSIAEKVYGDRSRWREIMAANPKIKDPNRLTPGQTIVLPQN